MPSISGRVAQASRLGLEDLLERKLLEEQIAASEQQRAIDNQMREREMGMRDRDFTFRESEAATNRAERDAERARRGEAEAGERRTLGNMAGVLEMTGAGMDPETARREIAMTGLRGGVEPPRMIEGLLPVPKEPKRHLVTTPGPGGRPLRRLVGEDELLQGVPEYREPKVPRAPTGQLSQRDLATAMREARRDAMTAYRTEAGPTGRVTDEAGEIVDLEDYVDRYVEDYMAGLEQLMMADEAPAPSAPGRLVRVAPPTTAGPQPPMMSSRGSTAPPPPGAQRLSGPLRSREEASGPPRPKVGDVVTLRDGTRVLVTGFDAAGKVQGARVP